MELEAIDVHPSRCQNIQVDVIELLAKGPDRPFDDIADVGVGIDEPAIDRIELVLRPFVPDCLGDAGFRNMVVLPDITIGVQNGDFPVQVPTPGCNFRC
jgi:hypothetical protein